MFTDKDKQFLERAIELSRQGIIDGQGGPFGCVIVKGDEIVGRGLQPGYILQRSYSSCGGRGYS